MASLGSTYPQAVRVSCWVQSPRSTPHQRNEAVCPGLHRGCKCHRSPRVSCMSGVDSSPVSQHRLPELKCLLTQTGSLWTRLGSATKTKEKNTKKVDHRTPGTEEDDSELQRAWGALIKEKEQSRQKKSRLDNLPSLQIEVSRESSSGSEAES